MLTVERLREVLDYNSETGIFTWKINTRYGFKGRQAGTACHDYLAITIDKKKYLAHRLAWFHANGSWPKNEIDHRNLDKRDNRLDNIREATRSQNQFNVPKTRKNKSGYVGVFFNSQAQKFHATHRTNGKTYHVGYFHTAEDANTARVAAVSAIRGEYMYSGPR